MTAMEAGLEEVLDAGDGAVFDVDVGAGEAAEAVKGKEAARADDKGIDLDLFDDGGKRRGEVVEGRGGIMGGSQGLEAGVGIGEDGRGERGGLAAEGLDQLVIDGDWSEVGEDFGGLEEMGRGHGGGRAFFEARAEVFDLDAARAHGHDGAELAGIAGAEEELRAEAEFLEVDFLADQDAADIGGDGGGGEVGGEAGGGGGGGGGGRAGEGGGEEGAAPWECVLAQARSGRGLRKAYS